MLVLTLVAAAVAAAVSQVSTVEVSVYNEHINPEEVLANNIVLFKIFVSEDSASVLWQLLPWYIILSTQHIPASIN